MTVKNLSYFVLFLAECWMLVDGVNGADEIDESRLTAEVQLPAMNFWRSMHFAFTTTVMLWICWQKKNYVSLLVVSLYV